jgi:hypothetical protein
MTFTDAELEDFWNRALRRYAMETRPASNDPHEVGGLMWWLGMGKASQMEGETLSIHAFADLMEKKRGD